MNAFEYASPTTVEEAVRLLQGKPGRAKLLAGGTDLLSLMKDGLEAPARLVSVRKIATLRGIAPEPGGGFRIGAAATLEDLLDDAPIAREYPALRQAASGVSSPQIRNLGTVAGDLLQRPRCWYYRNGFGLLALRDGKSMVPLGDHRYHAILGNSGSAFFVHASSLAPPLIALAARIRVLGAKGPRELPLEKLYRIPAGENEIEHLLAPDEVVTEIVVPAAGGRKSGVYEVREKTALDWPLAAAAVSLEVEGATVRRARVVLGHVAPIPWVAADAEKLLVGAAAGPETASRAAEAAVAGATPLARNAYKVRLAKVAVKRAILRALGQEV